MTKVISIILQEERFDVVTIGGSRDRCSAGLLV